MISEVKLMGSAVVYVAITLLTLVILGVTPPSNHLLVGFAFGSLFAFTKPATAWAVFGPGNRLWRLPLAIVLLIAVP